VIYLWIVSNNTVGLFGCETYLSGPAPIITSWLSLKIGSLFIIENPTKAICHTRWNIGNSLQWAVLRYGINDVLLRCGSQCFLVRFADCFDRWILYVLVACDAGGVIWTFVMITSGPRYVEPINDISALKVLLSKMRGTVSNLFVFADRVKWPVRHVSRISLLKRATACKSLALRLDRCWVTRSASAALVQGSQSLRAVVRVARLGREMLTTWASRIGRGRVFIPPSAAGRRRAVVVPKGILGLG
jgi:hypothetical protein